MKYILFVFINLLFLPVLFSSCASSVDDISRADSTTFSSSIASFNSPSRKIIHNADVRCRVRDVYKATAELEELVLLADGQITDSKIENEIHSYRTMRYKPDSQKIVQEYTGIANLTLRLPYMLLDTVMKFIPKISDFVHSRTRKQTDVTLAYLANAMRNEAAGVAPPVVPDPKSPENVKPNPEKTKIAEGKEEQVLDRRIQNLQILDDANYATLKVQLYQPIMSDIQVIADPAGVARTQLSTGILIAIIDGWNWLKPIITFLIGLWPLWAILFIAYSAYKMVKKKKTATQHAT